MFSTLSSVTLIVLLIPLLNVVISVYSRPSLNTMPSGNQEPVLVAVPPQPAPASSEEKALDPADFRGATGRHARSGGYIGGGGMGGMGTALMIQQMMAAQNAHNANAGNCSGTPGTGADMQSMLPLLLAMQSQPVYRGGFS